MNTLFHHHNKAISQVLKDESRLTAVSIVMIFFLSVTMLLPGSIESVLGSKIVKSEAGAAPFPRTCAVSFLQCSYYQPGTAVAYRTPMSSSY